MMRRDLLTMTGAALASAVFPSPAEAPSWEAAATAQLAAASGARKLARGRLDRARDRLRAWEARNPFPAGDDAMKRYAWAQAYRRAYETAGIDQRRRELDGARALCDGLCTSILAAASASLEDRQALARLLPFDTGGVLATGLIARSIGA